MSHCSLNVDAPSVGYRCSLIVFVLENCLCGSLKVLVLDTRSVLL